MGGLPIRVRRRAAPAPLYQQEHEPRRQRENRRVDPHSDRPEPPLTVAAAAVSGPSTAAQAYVAKREWGSRRRGAVSGIPAGHVNTNSDTTAIAIIGAGVGDFGFS